MTTREYLSQIRRYDKMIENKSEEIYNLRSILYGTGVQFGTDRVQTSGSKDRLSDFMAKIIDSENELWKIAEARKKIVSEIESIENTDEYNVLAKKYILQKDIKEIAFEEKRTMRQTFAIISRGIENFEKKYGKQYRD